MNRQEINDNIFLGFAKIPDNIMPSEYSPRRPTRCWMRSA